MEDENEDIHLSLSPSASPIPDEAVFDDIDLNSSSKTTATNEVPQVPAGLSKYAVGVGYRDVRSAPTRSTSVWDSVLGCLKPVMSLMNKSGKPSNLQKSEKGNLRFISSATSSFLFLRISPVKRKKVQILFPIY